MKKNYINTIVPVKTINPGMSYMMGKLVFETKFHNVKVEKNDNRSFYEQNPHIAWEQRQIQLRRQQEHIILARIIKINNDTIEELGKIDSIAKQLKPMLYMGNNNYYPDGRYLNESGRYFEATGNQNLQSLGRSLLSIAKNTNNID